MVAARMVPIEVENLLIDLENPRYDLRTGQRDALATLVHDQGDKLANLAEDIAVRGLNPSELTIVAETDKRGIFCVLEGNRRVAALKILLSPTLLTSLDLPPRLVKRYRSIQSFANGIPDRIACVIMPREDAKYWIMLKHTGENNGVGVVGWDGPASHRFRGSSPALQAVDLVENRGYLDEDTKRKLPKIPITNVERVLNTPDARALLGVDVRGNKLVITAANEEEAMMRLAMLVADVAKRHIRVTDLDTKAQRVAYAQKIAARPLVGRATRKTAKKDTEKEEPAKGTKSPADARRIRPERRTLIPSRFVAAITQHRINQIYHELQKLNVDKFPNACAVLFRVFVELSVDDFGQRKTIPLKKPRKPKPGKTASTVLRDMTLREKIKTIAEYMEQHAICSKDELRGIRTAVSGENHILSIDSLNAYVHSKSFHPSASDLKTSWDNVQLFIERIWMK